MAEGRINLDLGITIYGVYLIYLLQKFQNIGWYTGVILVQLTPKNMESVPIFPKRFFFFTHKKKTGRSLSGEGWKGLYVGTVKKKNHTPSALRWRTRLCNQ